jgi:hypothetical protein
MLIIIRANADGAAMVVFFGLRQWPSSLPFQDMAAVGELVKSTSGQWMVRPPLL